jgi:ABC-type nitrate/sulfonate/bicarbonate transport system substrate-binding protein
MTRSISGRKTGAVIGLLACLIATAACSSAKSSAGSSSSPAAAGSSATSAPSSGTAPTVVKVACTPSMGLVPQAYMMKSGLDVKNGIKLECINVTTAPQQGALLVAGGLDVTNLLPTNVYTFLDSGIPVVAFLPIQNGTSFDILVRKGFPLPDQGSGWQGVMRDLAKAKIGVPAIGAAGEDLAKGLFQQADVSTTSATYIATGAPATTIAALTNKSVDAAITFEPGISEAISQGVATQPFSLIGGTGPASMSGWGGLLYATTKSYAAAHPTTLKEFEAAYEAALSWMTNPSNHSQVVQFAQTYLSVTPAVAESIVTHNLPSFSTDTTVLASRYDAEGDFFHTLGATKKAWHVADYAVQVSP